MIRRKILESVTIKKKNLFLGTFYVSYFPQFKTTGRRFLYRLATFVFISCRRKQLLAMSEDKSKKILEGKLDKSQGEFVGRSGLTYQSKESVASKSQVSQCLSFPISPAYRCVNVTPLPNSQIIGEAKCNSPALRCSNVTHLPNNQITGEAIYLSLIHI